MSAERPCIDKEHPRGYGATVKAAAASQIAAHEAGLGDDTIEMINAFNGVSIASGHPVLKEVGERAPASVATEFHERC
jgi:hypothetical protein